LPLKNQNNLELFRSEEVRNGSTEFIKKLGINRYQGSKSMLSQV